MTRHIMRIAALLGIVLFGCHDGGEQTVAAAAAPLSSSLKPTADNTLREASPFANDGTAATMVVSPEPGEQQATVLRFDQAAIQSAVAGRSVYSATLVLTLPDFNTAGDLNFHSGWNGGQIGAYRMKRSWTERSSSTGATWGCAADTDVSNTDNDCASADRWGMNPGDPDPLPYENLPTGKVRVYSDNVTCSLSIDVTADVRKFLSGTPNNGWMLRTIAGGIVGTPVEFSSRQGAAPARLKLEYGADLCPNNAAKVAPGQCGCDILDVDTDEDGVADCREPSLMPGADSSLTQWAPHLNDGIGVMLGAATVKSSTGLEQTLIRFDTAEMAAATAGRVLQQASLEMTVYWRPSGWSGGQIDLFPMNVAWDEGIGLDVQEPGSTWTCASDTDTSNQSEDCVAANRWNLESKTKPYGAAPSATAALRDADATIRFDVTADIKKFISGQTPNYGWILIGRDGAGNPGWVYFASKETMTPPRLNLKVTANGGETCKTNSDCRGGLVCRPDVATAFKKPAGTLVCWDPACDDKRSPLFECGAVSAHCGLCPACTPDCNGRSCGYDGCWGHCGDGECDVNEVGCNRDGDCASDLFCAVGSAGRNVCLPDKCRMAGLNPCSDRANAGKVTECGTCPACTPDCGGRECGAAPNGCAQCDTSTLGADEFCSNEGHITSQSPQPAFPNTPDNGLIQGLSTPGTVPGDLAVTHQGQASYTIPLELPPGRNGIEPHLALTYNSAGGNGYMGMGWGLTGLSAVQRCPRTIAQDGAPGPVLYNDTDRFCLDGNRLVAATTGGSYGQDGSEYRAEHDTFTKIQSLGRDAETGEPEYFKAWMRDGRIMTYRFRVGGSVPLQAAGMKPPDFNPSDSNLTRTQSWLLTSVEDRFGNGMQISYEDPASALQGATLGTTSEHFSISKFGTQPVVGGGAREYYPVKIEYTTHDGAASDRFVEFHYGSRRDLLSGYQFGVRYDRTQLLDSITAHAHGEIVYQYILTYAEPDILAGPDQVHRRSLLTGVLQCARAALNETSAVTCKPRTEFFYYGVEPGFAAEKRGPDLGSGGVNDAEFLGRPLTLDIDGNGQDDVFYSTCTSRATEYPFACLKAEWSLILNGEIAKKKNYGIVRQRLVTQQGTRVAASDTFLVDYDLDGKDDVLEMDVTNRATPEIYKWSFRDNKLVRDVLDGVTLSVLPPESVNDSEVYLLDANGDGATDMLTCERLPGVELLIYQWKLRLHNHTGFGAETIVPLADNPACLPGSPMDINGDGAQELLLNVSPLWHREGRTFVTSDASAVIWPVTGTVTDTALPATRKNAVRMLLDANGDGLEDVVEISDDFQVITWENTGAGFISSRSSINLGPYPYKGQDFLKDLRRYGVIIDYNADGRSDMVVKKNSIEWIVLRSQGNSFTSDEFPTFHQGPDGNQFFVYDADHDGMRDLVVNEAEDQVGSSLLFARQGSPDYRLAAITNGLGARTEIVYAEQAQKADDVASPPGPVYSPSDTGCGYPVYCRFPRGEVVRKVHRWDVATPLVAELPSGSPAPARSFFYSYTGAATDLLGRGSLGFESRTIVDGARNEIAAASGGYHATTLVFRNKYRVFEGPGAGAYPFVGIVQTYADIVRLPSGRDRLTSAVRELDVQGSSLSWFPVVRSETQRVVESPQSSPSVLKNVVFEWTYDDYGNVTHSEAQWADSTDGKPADNVVSDTTYTTDQAHIDEWLISLPRTSTVAGTSDVTLSRTHEFTYAEDSGGSGEFPFSGKPETITLEQGTAQAVSTRMTFDALGNVTSMAETGGTVDGSRTRSMTLAYDASAQLFPVQLIARNDGTDRVIDVEYDMPLGLPIGTRSVGRPGMFVSRFQIPDGFGRTQRVVEADGVTTNVEYRFQNSGGYSVRTTRAGAPTREVFFDVMGRQRRMETDAFDRTVAADTTYNALGLIKDVSRARAGTASADLTTFTYDALGRVLSTTLPPARMVERCYLDNVECTRNPRGYTSCDVLNEHGQLAFAVQAKETTTGSCDDTAAQVSTEFPAEGAPASGTKFTAARYRYSPFGDLISIVDPTLSAVTITPDGYGRQLTLEDPDRGAWQYGYNAFGELETITDPAGLQAVLRYDDLGRQISRTDLASGDLPQQVTTWAFDDGFMDKLTSTTSADGVVTSLTYDESGRLSDFARVVPGAGGSQMMARHHEYDPNGRLSMLRYDSANGSNPMRVRYSYNTRGYLSRLSRPNPTSPTNPNNDSDFWTAVDIDDYGSLKTEQFGNGVVTTRTYEPGTGFLDTVRSVLKKTELEKWNYDYDANGNLDTRFDQLSSSVSATKYGYDALDRMTSSVMRPSLTDSTVLYSEAYSYNPAGNIDSKTVSGTDATEATWTYDYRPTNVHPHAVKKVTSGSASQTYGYNAAGDITSRSAEIEGALAVTYNRLHLPSRLGTSATSTDGLDIQYDAEGTRVRKVSGGAETFYLDEHYSRSRTSSTGSFTEQLIVADGVRTVAEVTKTSGDAEAVSFLHRDRLGSAAMVTDPSGTPLQRRTYEAYGKRRTVTGTAPVDNRVDYTGHELDTEFGLINMKSRLYDPQIGRFMSPDSIIPAPYRPKALNPYGYVEGNPINYTDPTGQQADGEEETRLPPPPPLPPPGPGGGSSLSSDWRNFKYHFKVWWHDTFGGSGDKPPPPQPTNVASKSFDARNDTTSTSVSPGGAWVSTPEGFSVYVPGASQAAVDATQRAEAAGSLAGLGLVAGGFLLWEGGAALYTGANTFAAYYPGAFAVLTNWAITENNGGVIGPGALEASIPAVVGEVESTLASRAAIPSNIRQILTGGDRYRAFSRMLTTSKGSFELTVDDAADVIIEGRTLILNEAGLFPKGVGVLNAGTRELMAGARALASEFKALGFDKVIVRGERVSGPKGHMAEYIFDLTK